MGVPLAKVKSIDFQKLKQGDQKEQEDLFEACCQDGFFYLDMTGTESDIQNIIDDVYGLGKAIFALPQEELRKYDVDELSTQKLNGYKPLGRNRGDLKGGQDGFESYAIPKDGIMELGSLTNFQRPSLVNEKMHSLRAFVEAISEASQAILSSLSRKLQLNIDESFCNMHHTNSPSPDLIRMLKYHRQPLSERAATHVAHTDLGSLTFLFSEQFGLEILDASTEQWRWMEPKSGHAVVNIGDCLSQFTNKLLRSCKHRVGPLPGKAMEERFSFVYLMRPEAETLMKTFKSPLLSAPSHTSDSDSGDPIPTFEDWLHKKYSVLRKDTWSKTADWILMGK